MKLITRGSRMQRLIFVTLFRERGRDIALTTGKVGMGGIIIATLALLSIVAAAYIVLWVASAYLAPIS